MEVIILWKGMERNPRIKIEEFSGHSFDLRKLNMEDLLVDKEQWIVVGPNTKPISMMKQEYENMERKERSTI